MTAKDNVGAAVTSAPPSATSNSEEHVAFVRSVSKWLAAAGVTDLDARTTLSIGIADSMHAMDVARKELVCLLATDPQSANETEVALHHAVAFAVYAFDEALDHLLEMKEVWEDHLEDALARRIDDAKGSKADHD